MKGTVALNCLLGFVIVWAETALSQRSDGVCRSRNKWTKRLTGSSGTIFTPNYPGNFHGSMTCTWIITVPEGHVVKLTFTDFKLSSKPISGSCDNQSYVEIRDCDSENSKLIIKACSNVPSVVQSSAYKGLWIRFDGNNGAPNRGFKAHYEAIPLNSSDVECVPTNPNNHNLRLQGSSGTFQSPPYTPAKPPTTITCIWVITVPNGKFIKLSFESFLLQSKCNDYIEIRDGRYSTSKLKEKRLCDGFPDYKLKDIRSSGRYLRIEYVSHRTYVLLPETGFKAHFEAVTNPATYIISCSVVGALVLTCSAACVYRRFRWKHSRQRATSNPVPVPFQATSNPVPVPFQATCSLVPVPFQSQTIQPQPPIMELIQLPNSQMAAYSSEIHYPLRVDIPPPYPEQDEPLRMDIPPPYPGQDEPPPPYSVPRDPPPPYPRVVTYV